jgi:hypothetical protein
MEHSDDFGKKHFKNIMVASITAVCIGSAIINNYISKKEPKITSMMNNNISKQTQNLYSYNQAENFVLKNNTDSTLYFNHNKIVDSSKKILSEYLD